MTCLERHYAAFDGLNLTWECLEGIAKHNGPVTGALPFALAEYDAKHDLELATHASAEAQVAALSDDIAYNNHDLHDGIRAGLFTVEALMDLPVVGDAFRAVDAAYPKLEAKRRRHEGLRRVFGAMVEDVIETSRARLTEADLHSVEDVRAYGSPLVKFSDAMWADIEVIRAFLFKHMYRAAPVMAKRAEVTSVVHDLFPRYLAQPGLLPGNWQLAVADTEGSRTALARVVSDYIAGMTDRFALQEHARLIDS